MIIDTNMYYVPEALFADDDLFARFVAEGNAQADTRVYAKDDSGRRRVVVEMPEGYASLDYLQGDYAVSQQIADMDAAGVDKAVLKVPGAQQWMSLDMCRIFNDGMARSARETGGRLVPLAVIPPTDTPETFAELDRCWSELGMRGVQLVTHYDGAYLDDDRFASFFDKLDSLGAVVYVHHVPVPADCGSIVTYNNLRRSYGRCQDQVTAVGREVFSGFFDLHPHLTLVHSMMGGGFFAIAEMLFPTPSPTDTGGRFDTDTARVQERLRNHVFFELSHAQPWGRAQLECAVKVLGADKLLWGSSYPVRRVWLTEGPAFVEALDISDEEKANILGGNAQRVYGVA